MAPLHPPRKDDGAACRVCGCTQHNACLMSVAFPPSLTCSWAETSGNDVPRWLCSECSGTAADMAETIRRIDKTLSLPSIDRAKLAIGGMAKAAEKRYRDRLRLEGGNHA